MQTTTIRQFMVSAFVAATLAMPLVAGAADETAPAIRDASADTCLWSTLKFDDLNATEQGAWAVLGWTAANWNTDDDDAEPASEDKKWSELSPEEQTAAMSLGYDAKKWDDESCDD